jgi:2,3-bisphosphoglycerate-independent phosphoglycerate mutase
MTEYERDIPAIVAFPTSIIHGSLGEVVAQENIRQLRMSESEKERFVTYYFNGFQEQRFPGEDRLIIPSPKVATYDLMPEMSARELTTTLIDRMGLGVYGLVVINFANADMVGHTGNIEAAKKACTVVDECVGKIVSHTLMRGGACVITADHGNVEEMLSPTGGIDTEHSRFPVPFIFCHESLSGNHTMIPTGKLADIAPTILKFMNITIPDSMLGNNLLETIQRSTK